MQVPSVFLRLNSREAPSREDQNENSNVDSLSFLVQKQQNQLYKTNNEVLPGLAVQHGENSFSTKQATSWVSKFPFQIVPADDLDLQMSTRQAQLLEPNNGLFSMHNCASRPASTKKYREQSNLGIQHLPSSVGRVPSAPIKRSAINTASRFAFTETSLGENKPFLKRSWNTTLMQSVTLPETLPGFFSQQKMLTRRNVQVSSFESFPDVKSHGGFQIEDLLSRVGKESADRNENSTLTFQKMKQRKPACGWPAQQSFSHCSSKMRNVPDVSVEALTVASEISGCTQSASMEALLENCLGSFDGQCSHMACQAGKTFPNVDIDVNGGISGAQAFHSMLFAACAPAMLGSNFHTSATITPCASVEQPYLFKGLDSANTDIKGEWGKFLADSKTRDVTDFCVKTLLPFEQRFKQLQEFLKKCDVSDMDYFHRAILMLSANAQGQHAMELESRALRLRLEEGKEIKRARVLNVLDEDLERSFLAVHGS